MNERISDWPQLFGIVSDVYAMNTERFNKVVMNGSVVLAVTQFDSRLGPAKLSLSVYEDPDRKYIDANLFVGEDTDGFTSWGFRQQISNTAPGPITVPALMGGFTVIHDLFGNNWYASSMYTETKISEQTARELINSAPQTMHKPEKELMFPPEMTEERKQRMEELFEFFFC